MNALRWLTALVAGLAAIGVVYVLGGMVGRVLRGSFGALVAAAVVAALGALLQWAVVRPQDFPGLETVMAVGPLQTLIDGLQALGIRNSPEELRGPLLALLAAALLALAGGALGALANRVTPDGGSELGGRVLSDSLAAVYRTLFWTVAAIAVLLSVAPALPVEAPDYYNAVMPAPFVLWATPALVFMILWRSCLPPPAPEAARPEAASAPGQVAARGLKALYDGYVADFRPHLLLVQPARLAPPAGAVPGPSPSDRSADQYQTTLARILAAARKNGVEPDRRWADELGAVLTDIWEDPAEPSTEAGTGYVLMADEEPTLLTFLIMAELALAAQDRGMTTLVVSAEGGVERIASELGTALSAYAGQETHRVYDGYGQPSGYYDVIVTSAQRLEADVLSTGDAGLADTVRRIGLVVVMDLTRMEAALLRLRFVHLSSLIGGRRPLVLVQSEPRTGLEAQVKSLLAPLGSYERRTVPAPPGRARGRWLVVWRNDRETLEALYGRDVLRETQARLPATVLEVAPFTLVRAIRDGFGATFYDIAGRVDGQLWTETLRRLAPDGAPDFDKEEQEGIRTGRLPYPSTEDRVIVVEDLANLAEALSRATNFRHLDEVLIHVLSHDYPLREFFAERLAGVIERDDQATLGEYLPIAPDPKGGAAELALAVATAVLKAENFSVSEATLLERVENFASQTAGAELWDTTRGGLTSLLEEELGRRPTIVAKSRAGHERNFVFHNVDGLRLDPRYLVPMSRDTQKDQRGVWLNRDDHGLVYGRTTTVQMFGTYYRVDRIEAHRVVALTNPAPGALIGDGKQPGLRARNRPRYRFARLYCPEMEADALRVLETDAVGTHSAVGTVRLLVRGGFERNSVARLAWPEIEAPFAVGTPQWEGYNHRVETPRAMRIHIRYALAADAPPPGDAGLAKIAFTVAATLGDVLTSAFAGYGERLAVLSPQAEAAILPLLGSRPGVEERRRRIDRFPTEWTPRLVDLSLPGLRVEADGLTQKPGDRAAFVERMSRLIEVHARNPRSELHLDRSTRDRFTRDENVLDLVLIEDASHDLGCMRALWDRGVWNKVTTLWLDYLGWCVDNLENPRFFYRFGAEAVPEIYDFEGARRLLAEASGAGHAAG